MYTINDFHGVKIGRNTIDCIEMLDHETCLLSFEPVEDGENLITTQAERWLDENKWKFVDNYYDKDGMFLNSIESQRLCGLEIKQIKDVINEFLKQVK